MVSNGQRALYVPRSSLNIARAGTIQVEAKHTDGTVFVRRLTESMWLGKLNKDENLARASPWNGVGARRWKSNLDDYGKGWKKIQFEIAAVKGVRLVMRPENYPNSNFQRATVLNAGSDWIEVKWHCKDDVAPDSIHFWADTRVMLKNLRDDHQVHNGKLATVTVAPQFQDGEWLHTVMLDDTTDPETGDVIKGTRLTRVPRQHLQSARVSKSWDEGRGHVTATRTEGENATTNEAVVEEKAA